RSVTAGHDAWAKQRPLLTAGHAGADEAQAALGAVLAAPAGVVEVRVASVDDDVALVEQRHELVDHAIDRCAGLHHDHDSAGPLERLDELLHALAAGEGSFVSEVRQELLGPLGGAVVYGDRKPMPGDVARQV